MSTTPSRLPAIQAEVRAIVPPGAAVEGVFAPTFALQAPVTTLVSRSWSGVNAGDLYVTRGVRWYVGTNSDAPAWAPLHPLEWSARTSRFCSTWGGQDLCLWQIP